MANDLTGDFDVVAELAIPAANRVLAAMHSTERFPHSVALRVDDDPPPGPKVVRPSIVGSVDTFGDATVNHDHIRPQGELLGQFSAADPVYLTLDPVVNADMAVATDGSVVPSRLRGRAQVQLSPPVIELADASGTNITVRLQVMARYFPDPGTSPVAEFVRGELRLTAPVNQVASQVANVIDVDIKADTVNVSFTPSQTLSAEDVAGINQLIRNALRTSFLPSNAPLTDPVRYLQFKTLVGAQNAIGALLNLNTEFRAGIRGNPASMSQVFLGAGDDFAFAAAEEFILGALRFELQKPPRIWVYTVTLNAPAIDFQQGKILLTIRGHAHTPKWYLPDFDFTVKQAFTLHLVATTAGGPLDTAELALQGDISFHSSSWIVNRFTGYARAKIRELRDQALADADARDKVRHMLSIDETLGRLIRSLLNPGHSHPVGRLQETLTPVLAYTSFEITPSGIVLHGSLTVAAWRPTFEIAPSRVAPHRSPTGPAWPPPHVEFEQIPSAGRGGRWPGDLIPQGPDYSALRTWIPGGAIQQYEWSYQGQAQPFHIDSNKFVLTPPPEVISLGAMSTGAVAGSVPICLTVRGERLSSSGPVVVQPVSATVCGYTKVSVLHGLESSLGGALMMVALTQSGPRGLVEVSGHASAGTGGGGGTPNRIVHFADEKTASAPGFLLDVLRESNREDAPTAVLAVLPPNLLARARYAQGLIYAEELGGAWARAFGVKTARRPVTLIAGPKGDVLWQHDGELDSQRLVAALRQHLVSGGPVRPRMQELSVRIGRPAPNFLFELAPGRGLTLRKLVGRPAALVFWRSASKPSIEAVRDVQAPTSAGGGQEPAVLAINDGDPAELARKAAADNRLAATIVPDPGRRIARAYGVNIWPTVVLIDAVGLVSSIRYGRSATGMSSPPPGRKE